MSIILLSGFAFSGKDFVGNILCTRYGYKRFAFADSLKKIVSQKYNCSLGQLHTQEGKMKICDHDSLKRTYRQILIDEALYLRNIDPLIFAKYCCQDIKNSYSQNKIVITDWRYPNELELMKQTFSEYKITTVHVMRKEQHVTPVNDISEHQLLDYKKDFILINNMDDTIYQEIEILITNI
jgi:hypothetical protein